MMKKLIPFLDFDLFFTKDRIKKCLKIIFVYFSVELIPKNNVYKLPWPFIKLFGKFHYRLIDNFLSTFCKHISILFFILIKVRYKPYKSLLPIGDFLNSVFIKVLFQRYHFEICQFRLIIRKWWLFTLLRIMLRLVKISKVHTRILSNFISNLIILTDKISHHIKILIKNLLWFLLLSLFRLLKFNLLQHINLLL